MFKHNRTYLVVAMHQTGSKTGTYTWQSTCGKFKPFEHVPASLLKNWEDYVKEITSADNVIITNFLRIKP